MGDPPVLCWSVRKLQVVDTEKTKSNSPSELFRYLWHMRHNLKAQLLVSTITFRQLPTRAERGMTERERENLKAEILKKMLKYLLFVKMTKNKREAIIDSTHLDFILFVLCKTAFKAFINIIIINHDVVVVINMS